MIHIMHISQLNPPFWNYLSEHQKDLIREGDFLMREVIPKTHHQFKDYSFLIFPYAKAYEGYLKQLFLDIGFISHLDYISDHFRLGKFLSSHLVGNLGDASLYKQIHMSSTRNLAEDIWQTWKLGRNQIFHYYPHNTRLVTYEDAIDISNTILQVMEKAYEDLKFLMKHISNE